MLQLQLPVIPRQPGSVSQLSPILPTGAPQPTRLWPSASLLHSVPLTLLRQHTRFPLQLAQKRKCLANKYCLFDNTEHYLQTVAPFNQLVCPRFQDVIMAHFKSAEKFLLRQMEVRVSVTASYTQTGFSTHERSPPP